MSSAIKGKFDGFLRKPPKPGLLEKTIEAFNPKQVVAICTNLTDDNGPSYLRLALDGCQNWSNSEKCLDLKMALIKNVLNNIMRDDGKSGFFETGQSNSQKFVDILLSHLDIATDLSPRNLAILVELCITELESQRHPLNPGWLCVLSKLISLGSECTHMVVSSEDTGNTMDGKTWRKNLIRKLCIDNWREEDATAIITMFSDISGLCGDEVDMIVEKACTVLSKINGRSEENVPPMVFQLLYLTRSHIQTTVPGNTLGSNVFGRITQTLAKHYNKNHDKVMEQTDQNILDSADLIDDNGQSTEELQRSESMVIFHLMHAVKMGHPIGKEIMKLLRSSSQLPDVIMANPFNMFVAFAITSIKPHRLAAIDCIKTATCKSIQLQLKREESAWLRQTLPNTKDAKVLLCHLIEQRTKFGGWDLIGVGLVEVAMCLFDSSCTIATTKQKVSKMIWRLGQEIVKLVIKRRSASILNVLSELTKRILSSKGAIQYTDCLRMTIKDGLTVIMEEPPTFMNELLDHFGSLGINGAKRVLVALMPLIKYSHSLRNATILILRKSLFSPNLETRRIAVIGVLQLLKYFRITSKLPITQLIMSQSSSCLSQAVVNIHQGGSMNNEALCLELMGVLKRGLSQQVGVRMILYQGIHDVVGRNPEICIGVLDMLYSHAIELKITNEDSANPIDVDSLISQKGNDVFVIEPVGWFLHCVQLMVGKANHIYGDETMTPEDVDTSSLIKLTDLLNRLVNIYSDGLDIMDLNFEKGADYSKATVTGRYNILRVETYKNIYEALMDYTIMHGAGVKEDKASLLVRLQGRHSEICELLTKKSGGGQDKTTNKGRHEKEKRKKAQAKDKDATVGNSELTQNKRDNSIPLISFNTTPQHAFSLKAISNILHSILNDNTPSNHAAVSQLRSNLRFQAYFLKVALEKQHQLDKILNVSGDGEANDFILKHLSTIASTLVKHCFFNPEADERLLVQTLECFEKSLKLVNAHFQWNDSAINTFYSFIHNKPNTFDKSSNTNSTKNMSELIEKLVEKMSSFLESDENQVDEDLEGINRQIVIEHLLQILIFLCKEIDALDPVGETAAKKVAQWIKAFMENCETKKIEILKLVLELFFVCHLRTESSDTTIIKSLAQEIHSKVGDVEALDVECPQKFNFVTSETGEIIFHQTANYLEFSLESAECIITRCKQIAINRDCGITSTEGTG